MDLKIEIAESSTQRLELRLVGRLDSAAALDLDSRLDALLQGAPREFLLDVSELSYISSAGLRCLFTAQASQMAAAATFRVLQPQPAVRKVLDTVRILAPGTIVSDRSELS